MDDNNEGGWWRGGGGGGGGGGGFAVDKYHASERFPPPRITFIRPD